MGWWNETNERLTKDSGRALIEEADRWRAAYNRERDQNAALSERVRLLSEALQQADSYLGDPSGSPIDAINLARQVIRAALAAEPVSLPPDADVDALRTFVERTAGRTSTAFGVPSQREHLLAALARLSEALQRHQNLAMAVANCINECGDACGCAGSAAD